MKKQKHPKTDADILRRKAESFLKDKKVKENNQLSDYELIKLIHELEVHQIELEMQNEELRLAKAAAEIASQKYSELYDFAPTGYFTLSKEGYIIELNLCGSQMLGKEHSYLKNGLFFTFVSLDTRPVFNLFLQKIISNRAKETCEISLSSKGDLPVHLQLTGVLAKNGDQIVINAIDISNRRQIQSELKDSEEHNRAIILHTTMDGFYVVDLHGYILEVNDVYCQMSGYREQELLTMRLSDLDATETVEDIRSRIEKIILHGEDRFETQHRRKDGSIFDVEISTHYQNENGGRFVAFLHDITDRKMAEENLRQSEERYKSLFKDNYSIMLLIDPETGEIKDANPAACQFYGWTHAELTSKNISDINSLTKEEIKTNLQNSKAEKNNHLFFQHRLSSGEIRSVEVYSGPINFGDSTLLYSIIHDITESKRAQDALIESELKFRKYVDNAPHGIFVANEKGEYIDVNQSACRITGYKKDELLRMSIIELVPREFLSIAGNHFNRVVTDGFATEEIPYLKKDGSIGYWIVDAAKLSDKVFLGFVVDTTERKISEEALKEKERLLRESQSVANVGSYSADLIDQKWKASEEIYRIFGINKNYPHTIQGWMDRVHPDMRNELYNDLINNKPGNQRFDHEYKILRNDDGAERWIQGLGKFEFDEQLNVVRLIGTIQDITERKIKEEALRKLNMTLSALSKSSQAMSQSTDEADYLKKVCKNVVENTDFAMVWIGFARDDEAKTVLPVVSAGFNDNYLETIKISWGDNVYGRGPTGVAIRSGEMCVCNNMLTDPNFEPWREKALKQGYASSIAFPLISDNKSFGAITIYSKEPVAFFEDEIKLLSKLANDLAHGITTIRLRVAHQLAEKALIKSHSELEDQVQERTRELEIANDLLVQEINIRKQQEQNLKFAKQKYRTVADFTYNWEYWINTSGEFNYISPSCERISGYTAEKFIQNPGLLIDMVHPEDLPIYNRIRQQEDQEKDCHHEIQYRIIKSDGSVRWVTHNYHFIIDESGNSLGIRGSYSDITGRKTMEDLLKTSNKKYRLLSENISDGIFIYKDGHFDYINQAMTAIFGYSEHELSKLKLTELFDPHYWDNPDFLGQPKMLLKRRYSFVSRCIRKDGTTIFAEFIMSYSDKDKVLYGVVHDISDKKQIQENIVKAIIHTEERERAHFSKELHDGLGPLLSTIKLYLQWSERSKINSSREEIIHKAEDILEEALTTVKEISNKLSPHLLINYGINSAIQNFVNKLIDSSGIQIIYESNLNRRLGEEIEAAIYRAVIECINNTIKYAQASNIKIVLIDSEDHLSLIYKDDGIGFKVDETIAMKKGLGLFNLSNRIHSIGGKILLHSIPGNGVVYTITIDL